MNSNHRIASGGATLAVEVVGSGEPIVVLHAGVCDSRMWRAQLDGLDANHTAIAYDRRGFGETRTEEEDFSAVADLMVVIEAAAHGTPAILVGCSQGGRIALDVALRHPSCVRGLVLIAPGVTGAPEAIYPSGVKSLLTQLKKAEEAGDLEQMNAVSVRKGAKTNISRSTWPTANWSLHMWTTTSDTGAVDVVATGAMLASMCDPEFSPEVGLLVPGGSTCTSTQGTNPPKAGFHRCR